MFLALAQLTNKAFTDAGKGRIRQSLTALVMLFLGKYLYELWLYVYNDFIGRMNFIVLNILITNIFYQLKVKLLFYTLH